MNDSKDKLVTSDREELAEAIEAIAQAVEAGQQVDLSELRRRFPRCQHQLARIGPSLGALHLFGKSGISSALPDCRTSHGLGHLGDFRLLRELGRGGMGVVYEAEQLSLQRRVAIKVLPLVAVFDDRQLQRFKNEALAAALLDHPNIVSVYSVGCEQGMHFYSMRLISGQSLSEFIGAIRDSLDPTHATHHTTPPQLTDTTVHHAIRQDNDTHRIAETATRVTFGTANWFLRVAEMGIQVGEGLEYAHQCGVLHRDIKPSNLLVDQRGKIWITDFGLARMGTAASLTGTGDLIGTLRYMSPEQAAGRAAQIDQRSDVYSLGATLYELCTLRAPFDQPDRNDVRHSLLHDQPLAPRTLQSSIPRSLETIILTAMAKSPEDRYASAQHLVDDLRRFINDQPIHARHDSLLETAFKWTRRHMVRIAAILAASLLLAISFSITMSAVRSSRSAAQRALDLATQSLQEERLQRLRADARERQLLSHLYPADIRQSQRLIDSADFAAASEILAKYQLPPQADAANLEWRYLRHSSEGIRRTVSCSSTVYSIAFSPNGQLIAAACKDGTIHLFACPQLTPCGVLKQHTSDANAVEFLGDGRLASASDDGSLIVWDVSDKKPLFTLSADYGNVRCLCPGLDTNTLIASYDSGNVLVWDLNSRAIRQVHKVAHDPIKCVNARQPSGEIFAGQSDGSMALINPETSSIVTCYTATGKMVREIATSPLYPELVITGHSHGSVGLLSTTPPRWSFVHKDSEQTANSISISPVGLEMAVGYSDGTVRSYWFKSNGKQVHPTGRYVHWDSNIWSVRYSGDGQWLACGTETGTVHLWPKGGPNITRFVNNVLGVAASTTICDNGEHIAIMGHASGTSVYNLNSGQLIAQIPTTGLGALCRLTRHGTFTCSNYLGKVQEWSMNDGQLLSSHDTTSSWMQSPDGRVAIETQVGNKKVISIQTGELLRHLITRDNTDAYYTPSGSHIVTADPEGGLRITTSDFSHSEMLTTEDCGGPKLVLEQGEVVISDLGREFFLFERSTRKLLRFAGHGYPLMSVAISPDRTRIATVSNDYTLRLWDANSGHEIFRTEIPEFCSAPALWFSHDMSRLDMWIPIEGLAGAFRFSWNCSHN